MPAPTGPAVCLWGHMGREGGKAQPGADSAWPLVCQGWVGALPPYTFPPPFCKLRRALSPPDDFSSEQFY